jgi:hypothetical protein
MCTVVLSIPSIGPGRVRSRWPHPLPSVKDRNFRPIAGGRERRFGRRHSWRVTVHMFPAIVGSIPALDTSNCHEHCCIDRLRVESSLRRRTHSYRPLAGNND